MQNKTIKIDIVSDVACPWCYVGKRRLEKAIKDWKNTPVEIEWHPFQLDPNIPETGLDRDTYLKNKFGDLKGPLEMTQRLKAVGEAEGISFNFGTEWLAVNTLPLHQLLDVAGQEGFKDLLKERFLKAYFDENLHLNSIEVLCSLMAEFGWDVEKTKQVIANDAIAYAVKQEIAHLKQKGVNSVPFFIINGIYGISGAQPSSVFLEAFEQLSSMETVNQGDNCDPTTGTC